MISILAAFEAWGWRAVLAEAAKKAGRWMVGDLWRAVAMIALGLAAWLAVGLYGLPLPWFPIRGWKAKAEAAQATLADLPTIQNQARAAQVAAIMEPVRASRAIAEQINAENRIQADRVRSAVDGYVRSAGSVCPSAGGGGSSGTGVPSTASSASGGRGPDLSSGMVAITRADLDGFTANTSDLDALRATIAALKASGLVTIEHKEKE
jgi:hypothetical protein